MKKSVYFLLATGCLLFAACNNGPTEPEQKSEIQPFMASKLSVESKGQVSGILDTTIVTKDGDTMVLKPGVVTIPQEIPYQMVEVYPRGIVSNPPTDPPPTGYGTLTYENAYNKATDINTNQLGRGSIAAPFGLNLTPSFKTEVRGSDEAISSGYRSEQQYDGAKYMPKEGVWEYDVYYQNWATSYAGGGHSVQWHPKSSSGSAVLSLQNYQGKFNVVRSLGGTNYHQPGTLMSVTPNKWYKMRWEIKWSTGNDGYIRLYIDNVLYYNSANDPKFTGKTSSGGEYFKLGQNRWNMKSGENTIAFYDNLKIYSR